MYSFSDVFSIDAIVQVMVRLMAVFLILPVHEFAHAWMADRMGDKTPRINDRLTLSPFAHIDPFGTLLMVFTGFGWAKPVPVDTSQMRHPRRGMLLTAFAGPFANLLMAFLFVIAERLCIHFGATYTVPYLQDILYIFITINTNLFVFNMLPVPPLDGSKILIYLLPRNASVWFIRHQSAFYYITMILMVMGILSIPMQILSYFVKAGMYWIVSLIPFL